MRIAALVLLAIGIASGSPLLAQTGKVAVRKGAKMSYDVDSKIEVVRNVSGEDVPITTLLSGALDVVVKGVSDVWIKLARCCTPVPPDAIFGFVTRSGGVSVHRDDCVNAEDLRQQPERCVEVTWKPTSASTFLVAVQVEALDRHKLLADITRVLSEERVNILSATVATTRDRVAISRFSFEMADPKHLGHLLAAVRRIDGVYDAYRVTSGT